MEDFSAFMLTEEDIAIQQKYLLKFQIVDPMVDLFGALCVPEVPEKTAVVKVDLDNEQIFIGSEEVEIATSDSSGDRIRLAEQGFIVSSMNVSMNESSVKDMLQAIAQSKEVVYCGELVTSVDIPSHGTEPLTEDNFIKSTLPGIEEKKFRGTHKTSHIYGFVRQVHEYDIVVFKIITSREIMLMYDTEDDTIVEVVANKIGWLRRSMLEKKILVSMTPGLLIDGYIVQDADYYESPDGSSVALVDGVFHYVPDRFEITVKIEDKHVWTRDKISIGIVDVDDGMCVVDARSLSVIGKQCRRRHVAYAHYRLLSKAVVVSDILKLTSSGGQLRVKFRVCEEWDTWSHPQNVSLQMLRRSANPGKHKSYHSFVASMLVQDGVQTQTLEDHLERVGQVAQTLRIYFRGYRRFDIVSHAPCASFWILEVKSREGVAMYKIRASRFVLNTVLTWLLIARDRIGNRYEV